MRRGAVAILLALPLLAGCVATAWPAQETVIENVAPLPQGDPGVSLHWGPPADPLTLAPGSCETIPWLAQAHGLPRSVPVSLDLSGSHGIDGILVGNVTPSEATLSGDDHANGTALVCATEDAPSAQGQLSLLADAEGETLAVASVRIVVTG